MHPVLSIEKLTKAYGRTVAVDEIDLRIESGQFVTLLGPSGCGKSTTLRMIGGFEVPTSGKIAIDDQDITHIPPHRRPVNMVFQDYALFPHLTVRKNIAFGLELNGTPKNRIGGRVDQLLDMMQLAEHAEKSPHQLSGGQRQRVALARALAPDPQFLLLDEPLSALDAKLRHQMQFELKTLQRQTGKTFVLVTHDQTEALSISDKIIVMDSGKIRQIGSAEDLYRNPNDEFVANFVGETNMLSCTVTGVRDNVVELDWNGHKLAASHRNAAQPDVGSFVKAALRPETIRCSAESPDHLPNRMAARLTQSNFTGAQMNLSLEPRGGGEELGASIASHEGEKLPKEVWIGWNEADLIVIDEIDT